MTSEIPDEVEERLIDLEGQVHALHNAREYLLEQVEELQEENEELREELEAAETAYSIAGETSEPARADGGPSKTRRAAILSRNEVVQQAITSRGKGGSVTAGELNQMAKPEMSILYRRSRASASGLDPEAVHA